MRHRKHWRSPEACVAVSLLSLFLDLRMLTGTGCFPWKPSQSGMDVELLAFELLPSQSLFSQGTSVPVPSERGPSTEGTADSSEEPLPSQVPTRP